MLLILFGVHVYVMCSSLHVSFVWGKGWVLVSASEGYINSLTLIMCFIGDLQWLCPKWVSKA